MKVVCPEHKGVVRLPENFFNTSSQPIHNVVVECPVCDDEVLINGVYDFDSQGLGTPVSENSPAKKERTMTLKPLKDFIK